MTTGKILPTPTHLDQELFECHRERLGLGEADDHWEEPQSTCRSNACFSMEHVVMSTTTNSQYQKPCIYIYTYINIYVYIMYIMYITYIPRPGITKITKS